MPVGYPPSQKSNGHNVPAPIEVTEQVAVTKQGVEEEKKGGAEGWKKGGKVPQVVGCSEESGKSKPGVQTSTGGREGGQSDPHHHELPANRFIFLDDAPEPDKPNGPPNPVGVQDG